MDNPLYMTNDVYQSPTSNIELVDNNQKYAAEIEMVRDLYKSQSVIGMIIATIIVCIPTIGISFKVLGQYTPVLFWIFPGFIVALGVRFMATAFDSCIRLIPAISLLALMLAMIVYFDMTIFMYPIALTNAVIVMLLSKRSLSRDQETALWLYRHRKISI